MNINISNISKKSWRKQHVLFLKPLKHWKMSQINPAGFISTNHYLIVLKLHWILQRHAHWGHPLQDSNCRRLNVNSAYTGVGLINNQLILQSGPVGFIWLKCPPNLEISTSLKNKKHENVHIFFNQKQDKLSCCLGPQNVFFGCATRSLTFTSCSG